MLHETRRHALPQQHGDPMEQDTENEATVIAHRRTNTTRSCSGEWQRRDRTAHSKAAASARHENKTQAHRLLIRCGMSAPL